MVVFGERRGIPEWQHPIMATGIVRTFHRSQESPTKQRLGEKTLRSSCEMMIILLGYAEKPADDPCVIMIIIIMMIAFCGLMIMINMGTSMW